MPLETRIFNKRLANMGTTVNAHNREAATAKLIVRIISLNSREIKPPSSKNGRIETRLVAVEANKADSTSWLLFRAISKKSRLFWF